jgi:nucleoside 2-deoxyribosyltransferase
MTRCLLLVCAVAVVGCGGKPATTTGPGNKTTAADDARSQLEIRRDAACEALGPRLTACAVAEARRTMTADELAKLDLEKTAPVHTDEFIAECQRQTLSSRQVRVYEVCLAEETECDPLVACLDNVNPTAAERGGAATP